MSKRIAIYTRVSTSKQTTDNQSLELEAWAARCGYTVVKTYCDKAISGSKGRDKRPGFDAMLKASVRREFDVIAVWSSDRLGRSLQHLIDVLQTIRDTKTELYIHTQALDTTTPAGRAMFGMLSVFAEFEREMIVARVNAGLDRARAKGTTLGRPTTSPRVRETAMAALQAGSSVREAVRASGASLGVVAALRKRLIEDGSLAAC